MLGIAAAMLYRKLEEEDGCREGGLASVRLLRALAEELQLLGLKLEFVELL